MAFINPLDKLPQWRQDYANHIAYGGMVAIIGAAVAVLFLSLFGGEAVTPALWLKALRTACQITIVLGCLKKLVDWVLVGPPTESAWVCVSKAVVTAFWPASMMVLLHVFGPAGSAN